jgi:hypothetical protein
MTGPLLALALAATPEVLLPPWPLSPDGELVALRGGVELSADAATVERVGAGLFRVVPAAGAVRVTLRAGAVQVVAPVEPPPGTIALRVEPPAPVKNRDRTVALRMEVRRASGELDADAPAPVVKVSSGTIRDIAPEGPGLYRAVYELASTRHPEVAVLLALVPRCPLCPTPRASGHAVLPLASAVDLPGTAEPGARTTVTIAGRSFGPVAADARGNLSIPVLIPPGAHVGSGSAVDTLGNQRVTPIDLKLPEVDRLACAAWPQAIPADGRSESAVWCVAATIGGAPLERARLTVAASVGEVSALEPASGPLQRARYRPPSGGGGRVAALGAAFPEGGAASRDEVRIALVPGPPAEISATVPREPVPVGAAVPAEVTVRDARGDLVGRAAAPPGSVEGFVASDRFVARAAGRSQEAPLQFALAPGGEVATLTLRRDRQGWIAEARTVDGRPAAGAPLRFGGGAVATTDDRGEARAPGPAAAQTVVAPGGARAAGWAGIAPPPAPFEISRTVQVALRPASPVDVAARVEAGAVCWHVEDAAGRPLPGRRVAVRAEGVELGPVERDGDGGRAVIRGGRGLVAVVDADTGVAAVVEVR